jgi:hypothetical protein
VWLVVHEDLRAAKAVRVVLAFLEETLHGALGGSGPGKQSSD